MKPQLLQTSRQIVTTALTVLGVGLFFAVTVRAAHQVSDRQYTDGKPRIVSAVDVSDSTTDTVTSTARYATNLTPLPIHNPAQPDVVPTASSFTPRIDIDEASTTGRPAVRPAAVDSTRSTDLNKPAERPRSEPEAKRLSD